MAFEFLKPENNWRTHCGDQPTFGRFSTRFDFPTKAITQATDYPPEACQPWVHYNMSLGNLIVLKNQGIGQTLNVGGEVNSPIFKGTLIGNVVGKASGNKSFDIPHVTQKGKRIRHVCAEGPESGIYIRGRLEGKNIIELPEYWEGLVDPDTITVTLTQIGTSQDLIVDSVDWGKQVKIRSGNASNINCFYEVWGARHIDPNNPDEKLYVVYDGESPADYPGDNDNFIVGGYN